MLQPKDQLSIPLGQNLAQQISYKLRCIDYKTKCIILGMEVATLVESVKRYSAFST